MLLPDLHLTLPCLTQVLPKVTTFLSDLINIIEKGNLLHDLFLLGDGSILQDLGVRGCSDEFAIGVSLLLTASLAQFTLDIDLSRKIRHQEILLSFAVVQVLLDLIESLLWSKVWLVVKPLNIFLILRSQLFLRNLSAKEFAIDTILLDSILLLHELHFVHVIDSRVELRLLLLTSLLNILHFILKSIKSHFVNTSDSCKGVFTFVG